MQFPNMPARIITSPRGHLVHHAHVPDDAPGFQVRSTSCGRVVPASWNVAPRTVDSAPELVTCATCQRWAQYHLDRSVVDAELTTRLGAGWKDQPGNFLAAVDLEAAQQLLVRLQELDGTGEQPVAEQPATVQLPTLEQVRQERGRRAVRRLEESRARASLQVPPAGTPALC